MDTYVEFYDSEITLTSFPHSEQVNDVNALYTQIALYNWFCKVYVI